MMMDMNLTEIKKFLMESFVDVVKAENNSLTEDGLKYFVGSIKDQIGGFLEIARIGNVYFYDFESDNSEIDSFMIDVSNAVEEASNYKRFIEDAKKIVEKYGEKEVKK